jgi:peptide/nickel transport system substrate-binding protein
VRKTRTSPWSLRSVAGAGALLAVLLTTSSGAIAGAGGSAAAGTLTVAINTPPLNLDPAKDNDDPFRPLVYQNLIYAKADGTFAPGLARSWGYLASKTHSLRANKDFQLTLRHDARFSDGTPVTAQAVKTWFEYYAQANGPFATFIGPIASVDAVGNWQVIIHLKSPNPNIPFAIANGTLGSVVSPACVANPSSLATQTCGAGPYKLDPSQTVIGDHYTYVPNPYFYDKSQVNWSSIVVKIIADAASRLQAFEAGQVDAELGDPTTLKAAAENGAYIVEGAAGNWAGLTFDVGGGQASPLADVRVRQALNYAIDRKAITAATVGQLGTPISAIQTLDANDPKMDKYYPYDPAKAKSLLAAAGFGNGLTIGPVNVDFSTSTPIAQAVAKYLSAVGVTLNLNINATHATYVNTVLNNPSPIQSIGNPALPMWVEYSTVIAPGSLFNRIKGGWKDPALIKLWVKGSRAKNGLTFMKEMTDRVTTQAFYLPIFTSKKVWYTSPHIAGVKVTTHQTGNVAIAEWHPK